MSKSILRRVVLLFLLSQVSIAGPLSKTPIVFAHGLGVIGGIYESLLPTKSYVESKGYPFRVAMTPFSGTIEQRAASLKGEIKRLVPQGPFHLVGHSMGGLDARLAVLDPTIRARCLSVTTMATPHRGSAVANYVMDHLVEGNRNPLVAGLIALLHGSVDAGRQLTTHYMEQVFNAAVTDAEGLPYFSMGFYIPTPVQWHSFVPFLWISHGLLDSIDREGPNDGLVSIRSSEWGHSLGAFPSDHLAETAPLPFVGGLDFRQVFDIITANLDRI